VRIALRIAAVLVAAVAYYVVTWVVLWRIETVNTGPERGFGPSLNRPVSGAAGGVALAEAF
jgi:hypothetical protein